MTHIAERFFRGLTIPGPITSQLGTYYKGTILSFTSNCRTIEMEGEAKSIKSEEESWLTVLCCRRTNKVSCKNHCNRTGISMHSLPKGAKGKQKWMSFAMIHRLDIYYRTQQNKIYTHSFSIKTKNGQPKKLKGLSPSKKEGVIFYTTIVKLVMSKNL